MAKRRKLYFDFVIAGGATRQIFPCTQVTAGTVGDRYGNLLDVLEALTGSSPKNLKVKNAVTAFAVAAGQVFAQSGGGSANLTNQGSPLWVDFIGLSSTFAGGTGPITRLPYQTVGATLNQKPGQEAIYGTAGVPRHLAVRVRRTGTGTTTIRGTCYVQRQHSIEV